MQFKSGSQPILYDPRDDAFTALAFGAPTLPTFPKTLDRKRKKPKNQTNSLSCTKQTTAGASEYQDGDELNAAWGWARVCKRLGTAVPNGADPKTAMSVTCEEGELPEALSPLKFPQDNYQAIGNWGWSEDQTLKNFAERYRKAAYIRIPKVGDYFDSIRVALVNGQNENQVVMAFSPWNADWEGPYIPTVKTPQIGWHAFLFENFTTIGDTDYLIARNSYGEEWGDAGYQYFPRETVNRSFEMRGTGLFVFKDLTPEQIAAAKQEDWLGYAWRAIIQAWQRVALLLEERYRA